MTQRARNLNPGRSALDLFGAELRHWRTKRELSQAGLAELTHFSADLICKVEKAIRWPLRGFTEACDAALDTGGALARMWPWVETEHQRALEESANAAHADIEPVDADFAAPGTPGTHGTDATHLPEFRSSFLPHTGRGNRAIARTRQHDDTRRRPGRPSRSVRPGWPGRQGWQTWPGWPSWPGGAPLSLEEQLFMAAHESAEFRDHPSNVGPATIDQLRSDITLLSRSFANAPRYQVFTQTRWLRDRTFQLLDGRQRITQSRDLYFLAGAACGMLADITEDLGYMDAAMAHTRTGLLCAKEAGHTGLAAWIRCKQSTVAYYGGRPAQAAEFARRGQEHAPAGTVSVWLPALEARAASRLGDEQATRAALGRATAARERVTPGDLDDIGGILSFSVPKQHFTSAEAYLGIGDHSATVDEARSCLTSYQVGPAEARAYDNEASTQINMAMAMLDDDLEAARDAAQPAFGLAPELHNAGLHQRFSLLHEKLSAPAVQDAPVAVDLRDQIEDFLATSLSLPPT